MFSDQDRTNLIFNELLENDDSYDPHVTLLHDAMKLAEAEMADNPDYRRDVRRSPAFEQLAEEWEFVDTLIEVSGKVYIDDPDYACVIPEEWGMAHTDDYGMWFDIPNTQFVSVGPCPVTGEDEDSGEVSTVPTRVGYGMILPEDANTGNEEVVGFFALPEDVAVQFLRPSLSAIDYRLHRHFPDVMAKIDAALPAGSSNIMRKVHQLREVLPSLGEVDADGVEWLAEYIVARLDTDKQWPYVVTLDKQVVLDDPSGEEELVTLTEPIEQCVYVSGFIITSDEESHELGGAITFELASGLDAEKEIEGRLYAPLESIARIRSLRPQRSLREQLNAARIEKLRAPVLKAISKTAFDFADFTVDEDEEIESYEEHFHRETIPERAARQHETLQDVIEFVKKARQHLYHDEQSAAADATAVAKEIAQQFDDDEMYGVTLSVSGETVRRPNILFRTDEEGTTIRLPADESFVTSDALSTHSGPLTSVIPSIEKVITDETDSPSYHVHPMVLLDDPGGLLLSSSEGVKMSSVSFALRTLAPIADGQTDVRHADYEMHRSRFEAYDRLKMAGHTGRELVYMISDVERALYHGTDTEFVALNHVERLREIGQKIEAMNMDEIAIDAFSKLFVDGQGLTIGGVESTVDGEIPATVTGEFAGIVTDYPYTDRERLAFALRASDAYRYLPVDTVESFSF